METYLRILRIAESGLSSTDTQIGGTLTTLGRLEQKIDSLQRQAYVNAEPAFDTRLETVMEPIKSELNAAKAQLAETKTSLGNMATFIAENRDALTTLISVGGRMTAIEAQVTSMLNRLESLESDRATSWNQTATIISIIVAVVSIAVAVYFALI
jgi:chromosome segregation ATPase